MSSYLGLACVMLLAGWVIWATGYIVWAHDLIRRLDKVLSDHLANDPNYTRKP